jgi:hypothetical protein
MAPASRPLVLVAFTAIAALTLIVAALLLLTGQPQVSVNASRTAQSQLAGPPASLPPGPAGHALHASANASAPVEWILLSLAIVALAFSAWLWSNWGRPRPPTAPA